MGLLQNGFRHKLTGRTFGATNLDGANASVLVYNGNQAAQNRNLLTGVTSDQAAVPNGTRPSVAWIMPRKPGGLSARISVTDGALTGTAWAVKLAAADLTGQGDLAAFGGLVVNLLADIAGSGTINDAALQAFLQLAADLAGMGEAAGTASGLGALLADIEGSGTAETSLLTAIGTLAADILSYGALTPEGIRDSVWNALAANYNTTGTMGEKVNDAGSAANPWTEVMEGSYTAADLLRLIAAAVQGNATGLEDGSVAFAALDGTTVRIEATYVDGVRTITFRDAS